MYRWVLHKLAKGVAEYPKVSLGIVVGYVCVSVFELFPVFEIVSDFVVVLSYLLILRYIKIKRKSGEPLS